MRHSCRTPTTPSSWAAVTTAELRVERIWEGASEIQRIIIGRQLLMRGPQAVLEPH